MHPGELHSRGAIRQSSSVARSSGISASRSPVISARTVVSGPPGTIVLAHRQYRRFLVLIMVIPKTDVQDANCVGQDELALPERWGARRGKWVPRK